MTAAWVLASTEYRMVLAFIVVFGALAALFAAVTCAKWWEADRENRRVEDLTNRGVIPRTEPADVAAVDPWDSGS